MKHFGLEMFEKVAWIIEHSKHYKIISKGKNTNEEVLVYKY